MAVHPCFRNKNTAERFLQKSSKNAENAEVS